MPSYYRNLTAWQKAFELNQLVHQLLKKFPNEERFALVDQMRRSALSIASNIAEGSWRGSNPEYARFLHIAKWSSMELETQVLLAQSFEYISESETHQCLELIDTVNKLLFWIIKNL